ncbi:MULTISPECIES: Dyp-type peroxidase [unclassified Mesorhizobium]|uniref:Dyp-type peroxidase n=1 Tax=unclassified Mesorhizobium TaxID=325217 RepID=UPI00112D704E|nr:MULTISPECIES: Dyp-type peroxidase [unclassified Mesorhizobium]TPJ47730.1 Dyp-type peroxidase [Mesorhizobium sp. B2-6-6]MBZ9919953.1 Dyp-type peroxidase [Mesorhizobium sp. BR1-1-7]MBZ9955337.1 Dyp-type peroxidase [Mesorhizobium sp. BR1-1-15]MBZ9969264.1 Dyp-type peroxidase [Mesorhizobium sp. BR1-1-12]MBZ9982962.1 Dyp-type peroxidase [Mesorhizobium sp. BR-1-1-8]
MSGKNWDRVPIDAQSVDAPLSQSAIFLVVTIADEQAVLGKVCSVLGDLDDLVKTVGFRDLGGRLSCIAGIGHDLWNRLNPGRRPAELKRFTPIKGAVHAAPTTPGDLLFHIRSERPDMCFEFERILLDRLGAGVTVVDEVSGFRYFDARDLLGFVDGTANPTGLDLPASALVGDEDPDFAGGSYVVVQKYLHDLQAWARIPTPVQEAIIGRTKIDNIEIDDDEAPRKSHKSLATIEDADGTEHDILRDNMPFGRPGQREFGTYFIGYSRYLWVIEKMLQRMYVGDPPGAYDRLLDFSTPHTGTTFFAPTRPMLQVLAEAAPEKLATR